MACPWSGRRESPRRLVRRRRGTKGRKERQEEGIVHKGTKGRKVHEGPRLIGGGPLSPGGWHPQASVRCLPNALLAVCHRGVLHRRQPLLVGVSDPRHGRHGGERGGDEEETCGRGRGSVGDRPQRGGARRGEIDSIVPRRVAPTSKRPVFAKRVAGCLPHKRSTAAAEPACGCVGPQTRKARRGKRRRRRGDLAVGGVDRSETVHSGG